MIGRNGIQFGRALRWLLLPLLVAGAQAVEVAANLSEDSAAVGRPVQFQIQVQGASSADVPNNFAVDGLDIRYGGQSNQVQMNNFKISMSVVYTFIVIPEREGNFTIPSLGIGVEGKTYKTAPQDLKVTAPRPGSLAGPGQRQSPSSQQQQQPLAQLLQQQMQQLQQQMQQVPGNLPQSQQPAPQSQRAPVPRPDEIPPMDKIAFAQLIIPERKAFVGQNIPVEIRFYFDSRFRVELTSQLGFGGEGFTAEKLSEPAEKTQVIDGVPYNVFTFKTAITPIKAGALEIPPARLTCVVTLPSNNPPPDDFFGSVFGQTGMGEQHELEVKSNTVDMEVKALPREGRPAGFAGAIGSFTLDAAATPKEVAAGEPITLKLTVEGQGNFNAITEPALKNKDGWRIYPGATDFTPSDDTGFGGKKTFESMLLALESKKATPGAEFSYFDPSAEKYVTLNAAPVVIEALAGKATAAAPAPTGASPSTAAAASATPDATPATAPENAAPSILPNYTTSSFTSVLHRQEFWIANGAAALAFLALLAYFLSVRAASGANAKAAQRRRLRRKLLDEMGARGVDGREFAEKGTEYLESRFVSATPESLQAAGVPPEELRVLESMLTLRDESKYGIGRTGPDLSTDRRTEILRILKQWEAKA